MQNPRFWCEHGEVLTYIDIHVARLLVIWRHTWLDMAAYMATKGQWVVAWHRFERNFSSVFVFFVLLFSSYRMPYISDEYRSSPAIHGPYVAIYRPYWITYGPFMARFGPDVGHVWHTYGPYMVAYCPCMDANAPAAAHLSPMRGHIRPKYGYIWPKWLYIRLHAPPS